MSSARLGVSDQKPVPGPANLPACRNPTRTEAHWQARAPVLVSESLFGTIPPAVTVTWTQEIQWSGSQCLSPGPARRARSRPWRLVLSRNLLVRALKLYWRQLEFAAMAVTADPRISTDPSSDSVRVGLSQFFSTVTWTTSSNPIHPKSLAYAIQNPFKAESKPI